MSPKPGKPVLTRAVQIRWSDDDYKQLQKLADAEGIPISQAIRLLTRWALLSDHEPETESLTPRQLLHALVEQERS